MAACVYAMCEPNRVSVCVAVVSNNDALSCNQIINAFQIYIYRNLYLHPISLYRYVIII